MGKLEGMRQVVDLRSREYPEALRQTPKPPERLYVLGNLSAVQEGLAVVGARDATPYGLDLAQGFARRAAEKGVVVVSGGARGCDTAAHKGALLAQGSTVVVCGCGADYVYPARNEKLFQEIIDAGGALVSEYEWGMSPRAYMFRSRNRIIAGLSRATLIVEAGLPSGTFSTADEALGAGREVWAIPGAITSAKSRGANRLLAQGATPIVDEESFDDALFQVFGLLRHPLVGKHKTVSGFEQEGYPQGFLTILEALLAQPLSLDQLGVLAAKAWPEVDYGTQRGLLMEGLSVAESRGLTARYGDGRIGPRVSL